MLVQEASYGWRMMASTHLIFNADTRIFFIPESDESYRSSSGFYDGDALEKWFEASANPLIKAYRGFLEVGPKVLNGKSEILAN